MKRYSVGFMLLLLLLGITSGYVGGTLAKYTGQVTGSGVATVARWAFETDNSAVSSFNINLSTTADETTLAKVNGKQRIAPGTEGSFAITLTNPNSEVGVDFTVALDTISNKPTNLKFYKDANHTTELVPGTSTITGQLAALDSIGVPVTIYWAWAYETANGDAADTSSGTANDRDLTIGLTITGIQTEPGVAITTHIN